MTQLALTYAAARDEGIRQSAEHAEGLEPGWGENAYRLLCEFVTKHQGPFTSLDFRCFLHSRHFPVPVPKALGAVFKNAARARVIKRVGFVPSVERHGSPVPLWEAA